MDQDTRWLIKYNEVMELWKPTIGGHQSSLSQNVA